MAPRLDMTSLDVAVDPREDRIDGVSEAFDRVAFAQRALDLIRPQRTRVAVCGRSSHLRVEVGRMWGHADAARWAMVLVPATASRRAIALAVAELAEGDARPYVLDVLLGPGAAPES